jgi:hypothetical protein
VQSVIFNPGLFSEFFSGHEISVAGLYHFEKQNDAEPASGAAMTPFSFTF